VRPEWRPIAFGVIVRERGKVPWSFAEDRSEHFDEIAGRARGRGLPEVRYPEGWPVETYSLQPLRALLVAEDQDQLRAASLELYRMMFAEGRHLADLETVLEAVTRAGMDAEEVRARITDDDVKERLRAHTAAAVAAGVIGVPTVAVGPQLFWGDDHLEDAAAAIAA
jgi:2-hydroxychromene-2-carboxylate isomerase